MKRLEIILPGLFTIWIALSIATLTAIGRTLTVTATNILSLAFVPFLPLLPVLRALHLATAIDAYSGPSIGGFIVGIVFYDLLIYTVVRSVRWALRR